MFNASTTQEAGNTICGQSGANFDMFAKPFFKSRRFTVFEHGDKSLEATPRYPLEAEGLVTDWKRTDLRWINEISPGVTAIA
jgi:hypothetical protein